MPVAKELGFDLVVSSHLSQEKGLFTGRLMHIPLHMAHKAHTVTRIASFNNLDLSRCYAYGDSANDIPIQFFAAQLAVLTQLSLSMASFNHRERRP